MPKKAFPWPLIDMQAMYESGKCLQEIADILSSDEWQTYWIRELGREYHPHQKMVNKAMKRSGIPLRGRGAPMNRNGFWKGGRVQDRSGYWMVKCPDHPRVNRNGYVREHRLVMEKMLGRYLENDEVIHHIDDDPTNNDPSNLQLFANNAVHISETTRGRSSPKPKYPRPDDLIVKWYTQDMLSLTEISELIPCHRQTVKRVLDARNISTANRPCHGPLPKASECHRKELVDFWSTHPQVKDVDGLALLEKSIHSTE